MPNVIFLTISQCSLLNMLTFYNYIKLLFIFLILFGFIAFFTIFYTLWRFAPELPSYESITKYKPNLSSRIYSSDGLLLKSFYTQERIFIPENRIPEIIKLAFLSSEDKNFYEHYGIDLIAISRAFITNIINLQSNRRVVGASTITQQVVKNLLLSNELSYSRKIKAYDANFYLKNCKKKFDFIYLGFVLSYFKDPKKILSLAEKCLKKNGYLIVCIEATRRIINTRKIEKTKKFSDLKSLNNIFSKKLKHIYSTLYTEKLYFIKPLFIKCYLVIKKKN